MQQEVSNEKSFRQMIFGEYGRSQGLYYIEIGGLPYILLMATFFTFVFHYRSLGCWLVLGHFLCLGCMGKNSSNEKSFRQMLLGEIGHSQGAGYIGIGLYLYLLLWGAVLANIFNHFYLGAWLILGFGLGMGLMALLSIAVEEAD